MQKIRIIFSLLVLAAYMVASVGFGVHECSAKGTKHILLINSDRSCEQIHHHCSCSIEGCSSNSHFNNCCFTEIHQLDVAYDITETGSANYFSCEPQVNDYLLFALNISDKTPTYITLNLEYKHGPPIHLETKQILAVLAQWRL